MFSAKERLLFVILALVSAAIGLLIADVAVSGAITWGTWDPNAWYQSYVGEREIGGPFSGQRVISTNNGMLGLCVTPFLVTAFLLIVLGLINKNIPGKYWGAVWLAPALGFPVYAILFVNILYDSMGVTSAANPWIVSGLALVLTVIGAVALVFEKPR